MVTCQTLLIHVADADAALAEMIRVVRPGGLVVAAEPNNLAGSLLAEAALVDPIDDVLDRVRLTDGLRTGQGRVG